jgi:POT family proton-dependent oligopeptide transporter
MEPAVSSVDEARQVHTRFWRAVALVVGVIGLLVVLNLADVIHLTVVAISNGFGVFLVALVVAFFAWLFFGTRWTPDERKRLVVITVLFLGAAVFWSLF